MSILYGPRPHKWVTMTLHGHPQSVRVPTRAPDPAVHMREIYASRALGPHDRLRAQNVQLKPCTDRT